MDDKKIILIGGGGHCRSCIDVIEQAGEFEIAGIIDLPGMTDSRIFGYAVMGTDEDIEALSHKYKNFFITLGYIKSPKRRIELYDFIINLGLEIPSFVSPQAYVSPHASIGQGTIIMHNAVVNAGAVIGNNCIINSKALVEHDAVIGNHCHISTGAIINGGVSVGDSTFFGSGAVSVQNAVIPPDSFIKANSLFIRR
jgi:sugar O-acyltransferase (sialic acid O-acetyltransferase NeuD family)